MVGKLEQAETLAEHLNEKIAVLEGQASELTSEAKKIQLQFARAQSDLEFTKKRAPPSLESFERLRDQMAAKDIKLTMLQETNGLLQANIGARALFIFPQSPLYFPSYFLYTIPRTSSYTPDIPSYPRNSRIP